MNPVNCLGYNGRIVADRGKPPKLRKLRNLGAGPVLKVQTDLLFWHVLRLLSSIRLGPRPNLGGYGPLASWGHCRYFQAQSNSISAQALWPIV